MAWGWGSDEFSTTVQRRDAVSVRRAVLRAAKRAGLGIGVLTAATFASQSFVTWTGHSGLRLALTTPAYAKKGHSNSEGGGGGDDFADMNRRMQEQADEAARQQAARDAADAARRAADDSRRAQEQQAREQQQQQQNSGSSWSQGGSTTSAIPVTSRDDGNGNDTGGSRDGGSRGNTGSSNSGGSFNNSGSSNDGGSRSNGGSSDNNSSRGNDDGHSASNPGSNSADHTNGSAHGNTKNSSDGDGSSTSNQTDTNPEDNAPPPTVEKWLKQLVTPKKSGDDNDGGSNSKNKWTVETSTPVDGRDKGKAGKDKADKDNADNGNSAKGVSVEKGTTADKANALGKKAAANPAASKVNSGKSAAAGGHPEPIALPDFATPDILAVNASRKTLERAKALGFKARPASKFSSLDIAVTALVPPPGMNPVEAKALLSSDMPQAGFAPNLKYRIYRTASGTDGTSPGTRAAAMHQAGTPADCSGDHCFGRDIIGWKPEMRSCVNGVRIGIIDTSVDVSHPAFAGKKLEVHHFGADGAPPGPDWHGTGVTALLAGDALSGTPGMIPDANFFIADIFHADTDHEPASDTVSMLRAFDWLDAKGVKIVNMSLSGPPDDVIKAAIEKMSAKGVLFVAAAGNEGPKAAPSYPAAYDQVIAVTAVTKDLQSYRYANRGSYIDVAAPGVAIWTALPGSKEGYHSGTSFATPFVTAALAAVYPRMTSRTQAEALQLIEYKDLGAPGRDPIYGQGLLVAPSSCSGGQIASARPTLPGPAPASTPQGFSGVTKTAAPAPIAARAESLPWLTLQPAGN